MSYYLGVDLGGTNIVAGVVDAENRLLLKAQRPTGPTRGFAAVVADMAETAREALAQAGLEQSAVEYVGVGAPSSINPATKRLVFANNLGWKDVDIVGEFRKSWDVPVHLANDADCAALGESVAGAGKGYGSVLMITLGTGVGGGLVVGGKLFLGGTGFGIEPGHTTLIQDGFPCTCRRLGCIEAYASVTALIRQTADMMLVDMHSLMWEECGRDLNRINGRTAFDAARRGDAAAQKVVNAYIRYVGLGISSLVTVLCPHAVLVGGGVSNEGEYLLAPVREIVHTTMYAHDVLPHPAVLKAQLGNDAGIIGAALLGAQGR